MVNERARFMRVANIRCERVCFLLEACETGFGVCLMPAFQERGHTYMVLHLVAHKSKLLSSWIAATSKMLDTKRYL